MALTKEDLQAVTEIVGNVVDGLFKQYVEPLHTWSIEIDSWRKEVNGNFHQINKRLGNLEFDVKRLTDRMDEHVFDTEKKVRANEELIGEYYNDFVSQREYKRLVKRVDRLELKKKVQRKV